MTWETLFKLFNLPSPAFLIPTADMFYSNFDNLEPPFYDDDFHRESSVPCPHTRFGERRAGTTFEVVTVLGARSFALEWGYQRVIVLPSLKIRIAFSSANFLAVSDLSCPSRSRNRFTRRE